jgi:hypothetical protein
MMIRSISLVLIDSADGNPCKGMESAAVSVDSSCNVDDFRRTVTQKYCEDGSDILDDIHPFQLQVFKYFQDFDRRNINDVMRLD